MKKNPAFGRVGEAVQPNREAGGTSKAKQSNCSRICLPTLKLNFDLNHFLSLILRFIRLSLILFLIKPNNFIGLQSRSA